MDPEQVLQTHGALRTQVGALESVGEAVARVRLASLSPSSYGIAAGALVVAPQSIAALTNAVAQLRSARSNADSLVGELVAQIEQQVDASSAGAATRPPAVAGGSSGAAEVAESSDTPWWELPDGIFEGVHVVSDSNEALHDIWLAHWIAQNTEGVRSVRALDAAAAFAGKFAPEDAAPGVSKLMGVLDSPALRVGGKVLGVVGSVVSVGVAVHTWLDPKSTAWEKTRDTVAAGLAVAGTVALIVGAATPVGWVILGAGLAWTLGSLIVDHHAAIGKFLGDSAKNVGSAIASGAKMVANAQHAADVAVTHAATDVVNAGKSFVGGITHGLGLGWP